MSTEFRDARLKIKRADHHISEMTESVIALETTYTSTTQRNQLAVTELVHEVPDLEKALLDLALIIGDAMHNLRSALDFAWASVIDKRVPNAKSSQTKFPFRPKRCDVEAALHGINVDTLYPALFTLIVSDIQPYDGGKGTMLWTLHELDIMDKHLLLLELRPAAEIRGIVLKDADGRTYRGNATTGDPDLYRSWFVVPFEKGIEVQDRGQLAIDITIKEANPFHDVSILELLPKLSQYVHYVVELLETV